MIRLDVGVCVCVLQVSYCTDRRAQGKPCWQRLWPQSVPSISSGTPSCFGLSADNDILIEGDSEFASILKDQLNARDV